VESTPKPLERLTRSVRAIADHKLHVESVRRFVTDATAGEAVESTRLLMADLERPGYRAAYQALVQFFLRRERVSYARAEELYRAAYAADYVPVRLLLLRAPPRLVAHPDEVLPDPQLIDISLGRRKAMARGHERDMLTRLCLDPSPPVVTILLQNPQVVEADVVRVAARRPNMAVVLEIISVDPKWSQRYNVQRALVQNPYTPTSIAACFTPFLIGRHLLEVARDLRLADGVRDSAAIVRTWRAMRRGVASSESVGTRH